MQRSIAVRGDAAPAPQYVEGKARQTQPKPNQGAAVPAALWLMVWMGYNTEIGRLSEPGFPTGFFDLVHGIRSLFPFIAAFMAGIIMLKRGSILGWPVKGSVGLVALYTLIGVISSALLSPDPSTSLYWVAEYGCAIVVLWAILTEADPLPSLSRLLTVNWFMVAVATIGLLVALSLFADVFLAPSDVNPLGAVAFTGEVAYSGQFLDMPSTRNTGFGRFATLAVLICIARLWQGKAKAKLMWVLLLPCLLAVVLSQARTAVLALIAGILVLFWVQRRSKLVMLAGIVSALILMGLTGFFSAFWGYFTKGQAFDPTLSGRTAVWGEGWALFMQSPLMGFGFLADRLLLDKLAPGHATDVHNALLHALIQAGLVGTVPLVVAFLLAWKLSLRCCRNRRLPGQLSLPIEVPALLAYVTVASITESTFTLYSVPWLILAPCLAYSQLVARRQRAVEVPHPFRQPAGLPFRQTGFPARKTAPRADRDSARTERLQERDRG